MTAVPFSEVFQPYSAEYLADPYPTWAWYREHRPVAQVEFPVDAARVWWVTRHHDLQAMLYGAGFAASKERSNAENAGAQLADFYQVDIMARNLLAMDAPDHPRLRKTVVRAFSTTHMKLLEPFIVEVVDALIADVADKGEVDFVSDFALELPMVVISELLGTPLEMRAEFARTLRLLLALIPGADNDGSSVLSAMSRLDELVSELKRVKRAHPADDLVTRLVQMTDDDRMDEAELSSMIFILVAAGYTTTVDLLANGMLALLDFPDQLALLRQRGDLVSHAVDEMLRYDGPIAVGHHRFPITDVTIAGVTIPAGDPVLPLFGAANRDPAVFADPDRFDITRPNLHHVAFGHGVHYCLGAVLGRLEARIAFAALIDRFPTIALSVPRNTLAHRPSLSSRSLAGLPLNVR
ncbi:cytochrome P450 [Streptomyces sp. NPDC088748]|uniref:cytochrome P450 family protein n=1 Tax=Streptomyces sp. NPDC088748 TaxID=3365887 RepID=UPI0037F7FC0D